ncbi:hypothetical protein Y023_5721 [Burkholderia pseudomallei A79D]|nr:hypothetical protein Y023_5721 [Burkholderia pseudomallei A79D]KOT22525.1 hypothetical protein DM52_2136 [Burkholderia mallei]
MNDVDGLPTPAGMPMPADVRARAYCIGLPPSVAHDQRA